MNPISQRLLNQQLICPQFTTPHDVVAWMGAMQAQEYKMMRWAVGMRTRRPSARAFEQDYNSGRIVRAHLFRTTWQLVAGEDLGWMLNLCRDNALRGMAGWMHSNGVDIPRDEQDAIRPELIEDRWKGLQLFRHLAVQPDHMHRAHSGNGIFWPVILQDGQAIGNWTLAAGKVQTTPFHPDTPIALDLLQEQIERYTSFQA